MKTVVQFFHPSNETDPNEKGKKPWSPESNLPSRTFIRTNGSYVFRETNDGAPKASKKAELACWAEWEPPATVIKKFENKKGDEPKYFYDPYFYLPDDHSNLNNTDPFIFGGNFLYCICLQAQFPGLKELEPGSIILFGSRINNAFRVDTVFVVKSAMPYSREDANQIDSIEPNYYRDIALKPVCHQHREDTKYVLYRGATFDDPINGMYSFVPCQFRRQNIQRGFERPAIDLDFISEGQTQGVHYVDSGNQNLNDRELNEYWEEVRKQVVEQGLYEGVEFDLPLEENKK